MRVGRRKYTRIRNASSRLRRARPQSGEGITCSAQHEAGGNGARGTGHGARGTGRGARGAGHGVVAAQRTQTIKTQVCRSASSFERSKQVCAWSQSSLLTPSPQAKAEVDMSG